MLPELRVTRIAQSSLERPINRSRIRENSVPAAQAKLKSHTTSATVDLYACLAVRQRLYRTNPELMLDPTPPPVQLGRTFVRRSDFCHLDRELRPAVLTISRRIDRLLLSARYIHRLDFEAGNARHQLRNGWEYDRVAQSAAP